MIISVILVTYQTADPESMQWKGCSSVINIQKGVQLLRMPGNFLARLLGFPFYFPSLTPQSSPDSPDSKQNQQNKQSKVSEYCGYAKESSEMASKQSRRHTNTHICACSTNRDGWQLKMLAIYHNIQNMFQKIFNLFSLKRFYPLARFPRRWSNAFGDIVDGFAIEGTEKTQRASEQKINE